MSYRLENKVVALTRELTQRSEEAHRLERERKATADKLATTKERLDTEKRARETAETSLQALTREKVRARSLPMFRTKLRCALDGALTAVCGACAAHRTP